MHRNSFLTAIALVLVLVLVCRSWEVTQMPDWICVCGTRDEELALGLVLLLRRRSRGEQEWQ